jgi:hypothetical protein
VRPRSLHSLHGFALCGAPGTDYELEILEWVLCAVAATIREIDFKESGSVEPGREAWPGGREVVPTPSVGDVEILEPSYVALDCSGRCGRVWSACSSIESLIQHPRHLMMYSALLLRMVRPGLNDYRSTITRGTHYYSIVTYCTVLYHVAFVN